MRPDASKGGPSFRHKRTFVAASPGGLGGERQPPATPNGRSPEGRELASSQASKKVEAVGSGVAGSAR